jgi:phage protein D
MAGDLFHRVGIQAGTTEYDLSQDLSSFTIEEASAKPAELTVNLSDPFNVFSHALQEGMTVEVDLGTAEEHSLMFRGRIYKVESSSPETGVSTLRLLAYDASMAMGLRRRNRPWTDMTLSEIVNEIAGDYFDPRLVEVSLMADGDPRFEGNGIRQRDKTDLEFLHGLARRYGCEMFVMPEEDGDALHFEAQYHIMSEDPAVSLYHGRCDTPGRLLSFEANSNVANIQLPRALSGIDYGTGEATEVTTTTVEQVGTTDDQFADENMTAFRERHPDRAGSLEGLISGAGAVQEALRDELGTVERQAVATFTTEEELNVISANQFSTSIHGMRASGSADGNPRIRAQANIDIANVGGRFSGTWYLSQVRHVLNDQGYQTEFECQR